MNLSILLRYKNLLLVAMSLLFLIFSYIYKVSKSYQESNQKVELSKNISDFNKVVELQNIWKTKDMPTQVNALKSIVGVNKTKTVEIKDEKLKASFMMLNSNELNMIVDKLFNMPLKLEQLDIKQSGNEQFMLDVRASW